MPSLKELLFGYHCNSLDCYNGKKNENKIAPWEIIIKRYLMFNSFLLKEALTAIVIYIDLYLFSSHYCN